MRSICVVTQGFPYKGNSESQFVGELVNALARKGVKCYVIAPQSITRRVVRKKESRPYNWSYKIGDETIDVFQPSYVTLSSTKNRFITSSVFHSFSTAVDRTFKKHLKGKVEVVYAHFWYSGICAGAIGYKYNLPVFVATGESSINIKDQISLKNRKNALEAIRGVVCVSTANKEASVNLGLTKEGSCVVIPNAVNTDLFCKMDKKAIRKELKFPENDFIVTFVGAFIYRKGVRRLSQAIDQLVNVKSIFIGKGNEAPDCSGMLFSGQLPHDEIPRYINAADVFVLPTLAEGCCNAIIEALACGIPVISSDRPFNEDILSDEYSIKVDPNDINQIRDAIESLQNNPDRIRKMSQKAYEYGHKMNIDNRATLILQFIDEKVEEAKQT